MATTHTATATVNPATLTAIRPTCPECHTGTIELVVDGEIGTLIHPGYHTHGTRLREGRRPAVFGACNSCEFCIEIDLRELTAKRSA